MSCDQKERYLNRRRAMPQLTPVIRKLVASLQHVHAGYMEVVTERGAWGSGQRWRKSLPPPPDTNWYDTYYFHGYRQRDIAARHARVSRRYKSVPETG